MDATTEIAIGLMERVDEKTGVFDGDFEIPELDSPGVAWDDDQLLIAHADDLGSEDLLHPNGLLEDWTPTTND